MEFRYKSKAVEFVTKNRTVVHTEQLQISRDGTLETRLR